MKHAKVGMTVLCQANGNMEHAFIGRIEKCYENAALVKILDYDPHDRFNVQDLIGRTVIAFNRMKKSTSDRLEVKNDQPLQKDVG
ncbi:hypothetical protein KG086_10390 [Lacticaseibacillus chiayiensis]|uniref:hypothetical protein n=1 Tax=Lacticaseibacillus chiayiensis TaxID=2100821 RepID=UPI001BCCAFBA|nr:hypothetical protein [Lacticaseibacillus chiayiensis]QVI34191.1 hypothetical protein KG086_10390 [Lacticaseibacillus chiayiensis]